MKVDTGAEAAGALITEDLLADWAHIHIKEEINIIILTIIKILDFEVQEVLHTLSFQFQF